MFTINYRAFPSSTSRSYSDRKASFEDAESFFRFYDGIDWGSYLYCLESIKHNDTLIWYHHVTRYSHQKNTSINTVETFRPTPQHA